MFILIMHRKKTKNKKPFSGHQENQHYHLSNLEFVLLCSCATSRSYVDSDVSRDTLRILSKEILGQEPKRT